jgi:four helix bundle protein
MGEIKSFTDLRTWQEGHRLILEIYRFSKTWPKEEVYGLVSQIRRAALSIPSNIAEGMGRGSTKDLSRFLINARGSVQEVLSQLILARDLEYLSKESYAELATRYHGLAAGINAHLSRLKNSVS